MNIFQVTPVYHPSEAGGAAFSLAWLNLELASTLNIHVLSTTQGLPSSFTQRCVSDERGKAHYYKLSEYGYWVNLMRGICRADVVHFNSLFFLGSLVGIPIAFVNQKKIIISPRGELFKHAIAKKYWLKNLMKMLLQPFGPWLNFHVTSEAEQRVVLDSFYAHKSITILPNVFNTTHEFPISLKRKSFVFVGRLNPIKNLEVLIEAFALLPEKESINLLLLGKPRLQEERDYVDAIRDKIAALDIDTKVKFYGHVSGLAKMKIINESAALVLPSYSENFGNVVLESLSVGTPVLTSSGTPWEYLMSLGCGRSFDPHNPHALQKEMTWVLNLSNTDYEALCTKAANVFLTNFHPQSVCEKWRSFYLS